MKKNTDTYSATLSTQACQSLKEVRMKRRGKRLSVQPFKNSFLQEEQIRRSKKGEPR